MARVIHPSSFLFFSLLCVFALCLLPNVTRVSSLFFPDCPICFFQRCMIAIRLVDGVVMELLSVIVDHLQFNNNSACEDVYFQIDSFRPIFGFLCGILPTIVCLLYFSFGYCYNRTPLIFVRPLLQPFPSDFRIYFYSLGIFKLFVFVDGNGILIAGTDHHSVAEYRRTLSYSNAQL